MRVMGHYLACGKTYKKYQAKGMQLPETYMEMKDYMMIAFLSEK